MPARALRLILLSSLLLSCRDKADDSAAADLDADGDGYPASEDCDDGDPAINPAATELDDDVDNDCDGVADEYLELYDDDGDGWSEAAGDCDDTDAALSPDASEVAGDGLDNDCDGMTDETALQEDADGDGYSPEDGDCDDTNPDMYPDNPEVPDSKDNDCNGIPDDNTVWYDDDGDGLNETSGDCDDTNPQVYPGAPETWYDGIDSNCDGASDFDQDGDGLGAEAYGGSDCDDTDATVEPLASELCDGIDNNCNGTVDEGLSPGSTEACAATSCLAVLAADPSADDGLYWLDPLGDTPQQVYCDLAGGGWALVYRATNSGGVEENGTVDVAEALGSLPISPGDEGNNKLSDDFINALRGAHVTNDIHVLVEVDGALLGEAWHPNTCVLQSGVLLGTDDPCNSSTTAGPNEDSYEVSGHEGPLTRWYVDADFGYIWGVPGVHIGPVEGGTDHEGELPDPYCAWYDDRTCPLPSSFEIWVN